MSLSASSISHAGATPSGDGQPAAAVSSDPNHSQTIMMSQSSNHSGPVQMQQTEPNGSQYGTVHRNHAYNGMAHGPDGYAAHHVNVIPYVPPPPSAHQPELLYSTQNDPQSQQTEGLEEEESPPPATPRLNGQGTGSKSGSVSTANGKRKQPDSATPDGAGKKRRQRAGGGSLSASAAGVGEEDGEETQDLDVGPNGGAKHWTVEEKTRFFTWLLTSDEHWDAFRTRMNTVFRECSSELFPGRKSYTALKSCYHRNLEVFKQVHAFQVFSANHFRQLQAENPNAEQPHIEAMLEAARVAGLNVGNLNVKVIDRWYESGWFDLFKRRYREDPKTGLPAPYFGPADQIVEPAASVIPNAMMGLHSTIDPQLMAGHAAQASPEGSYQAAESQQTYAYSPPPSQPSDYRQAGSSSTAQSQPSFPYLRSSEANASRSLHASPSTPATTRVARVATVNGMGQRQSPFPETSSGDVRPHEQSMQATQALTHLTAVTESLLGVCMSLKEILQQQVEESKARTELMRAEAAGLGQGGHARKDKEKDISIEKVTFATEILKNGPQNEEIKKAAIECLTKYLMRDL